MLPKVGNLKVQETDRCLGYKQANCAQELRWFDDDTGKLPGITGV